MAMHQEKRRQTETAAKQWIRGVNIGGWLLMERFIVPYMFAITSCHLEGDFCWYPGQISAPPKSSPDHQYCDLFQCTPHLIDSASGDRDFPTDEYTLAKSFPNKALAREYLSYHWDNFVTKDDVEELDKAGVTHVRVPLPHWIMGDIREDEPWVDGQWLYFVRFVGWCREYGIQVWPDIHTAPGSQNGFDNSGQLLPGIPTCENWSGSEENVERSLKAVKDVTEAIMRDNLRDVVTGFGILNEPFGDCDVNVTRSFNNEALSTVRDVMGEDTSVYIGDMFNSSMWNDGWWTDEDHSDTFLDSHYYHVFAEEPRALTPKQHIAYVCGKNTRDTTACCYEDFPENTKPAEGITRMIGEWSASYDTLPVAKLGDVMKGIEKNGEAPGMNRTISEERKAFLRRFVEAQMVAYESADIGISRGWFYWTLKMEGGAFAEWDFLRGLREGWIPNIPGTSVSSESLYGTCHEIAEKTEDDMTIMDEFPDPSTLPANNWQGVAIDDDFVLSHAGSLNADGSLVVTDEDDDAYTAKEGYSKEESEQSEENKVEQGDEKESDEIPTDQERHGHHSLFLLLVVAFFSYGIWRVFFKHEQVRQRNQYTNLDAPTSLVV